MRSIYRNIYKRINYWHIHQTRNTCLSKSNLQNRQFSKDYEEYLELLEKNEPIQKTIKLTMNQRIDQQLINLIKPNKKEHREEVIQKAPHVMDMENILLDKINNEEMEIGRNIFTLSLNNEGDTSLLNIKYNSDIASLIDFTMNISEYHQLMKFRDNLKSKSGYIINTDGASKNRKELFWEAGVGIVCYKTHKDPEKIIRTFEFSRSLNNCTNNIAEYAGVIYALTFISILKLRGKITVNSDSQLIVNQLNGKFAINKESLFSAYTLIKSMESNLKNKIMYVYVPREQNVRADQLAKEGMRNVGSCYLGFESTLK